MGHSKDMSADGGRVGKKTCTKKRGVVVVWMTGNSCIIQVHISDFKQGKEGS